MRRENEERERERGREGVEQKAHKSFNLFMLFNLCVCVQIR